jgi:hypothetical protein
VREIPALVPTNLDQPDGANTKAATSSAAGIALIGDVLPAGAGPDFVTVTPIAGLAIATLFQIPFADPHELPRLFTLTLRLQPL